MQQYILWSSCIINRNWKTLLVGWSTVKSRCCKGRVKYYYHLIQHFFFWGGGSILDRLFNQQEATGGDGDFEGNLYLVISYLSFEKFSRFFKVYYCIRGFGLFQRDFFYSSFLLFKSIPSPCHKSWFGFVSISGR